jgi:CRISPR-associated protein Csm4
VEDYRIRIHLQAPLGTPWQSDTVFGHLAWQVAGGAVPGLDIDDFLAPFRAGDPPFVLSDGFPGDLLPRPYLPVPATGATGAGEYAAYRQRRKTLFVARDDFASLRAGKSAAWQPQAAPWTHFEVSHASLNRLTEATTGPEGDPEGGAFFQTDLTAPSDRDSDHLTLYLRAAEGWAERVGDLLQSLSLLGFGRDRSTGVGAFAVDEIAPCADFGALPGANGFVSLSSYCPAAADPTRGRWRVRLKYGKLGENAGAGNPFKRPLIQFEPGAVFWTDAPPRAFYGRAVTDLAPGMPEAVHCCYTLAVPCLLPPAEGDEP